MNYINKRIKKLSLITFDVNGTLLNFRKPVGEVYADAAKRFGIVVDPDVMDVTCIKNISEMRRKHPNFGQTSGLGWKNWWKTVVIKSFDENMSKNNKSTHQNHLDKLSDYLIDRFTSQHEYILVDGCVDLLDCLKSKGVRLGVISNFDPRLHAILEDIGIRNYFTFVITSYEAGYSKPDKNIFKAAQKKFSEQGYNFDNDSAIHVGDSLINDYYGAINAGWNAVLITPFLANKVVNDVLHFKNLLDLKKTFLDF